MWWIYLASVALGYLLGSFPTGFLVARRHGIDIREHGSGNIGATNVLRVLGKRPGYLVFFCDAIKGLLSVRLAVWLASAVRLPHNVVARDYVGGQLTVHYLAGVPAPDPGVIAIAGILGGLACILGHNFPVWLRFRGGKGVATTVGVLLGLMPAAFAVAAVVWIVSFFVSRYVSLASLLAAAVLPVAVWVLTRNDGPAAGFHAPLFWFAVIAAALIFWRHRANIGRLLNGTEARFNRKPSAPST